MQLLFADQLGPHFALEDEILLPEVVGQFRKRSYHRQKAHLILYAIRARARDAGVRLVRLDSYRNIADLNLEQLTAVHPSSREMLALTDFLGIAVREERGFASTFADFAAFAGDKTKTRLEDFYRQQRARLNLLMDSGSPIGGRWNFDSENRLGPTKDGLGLPGPWLPVEDELDAEVRADLNRLAADGVKFLGVDGPRKFAATREEALAALQHFIDYRLDLFGPYEDAVDERDWAMSHSLLSVPMNLGLLDPIEVSRAAEQAYLDGNARIESVEGFIRQVIGWRDYVWHLYWRFGPDYTEQNALQALADPPQGLLDLDFASIEARCLSKTLDAVSENGWAHHIQRLMILGNIALQRGWNPAVMNDWFIDAFVDGTPWVMPANVIGMSLYADGGQMSTKPYAAGGSYINRMTNHCGSCKFDPKKRTGEDACPITAGYWAFLDRNRDRLAGNFRMRNGYAGLARLRDLEEIRIQENSRKRL